MTRLVRLLQAEFIRTLILRWRYPLELFTGLTVMYLIFLGLFLGARSLVGETKSFELSLSGFIVSYLMWFFAISALSRLTYSIEVESSQGVLEQIYLNYPRYLLLQYVRGFVDFIEGLIFIAVLLGLILLTTQKALLMDWGNAGPVALVVILTVIGLQGFGFLFGGLALLFKRIGQVGGVLQFGFFLLAYLPVERMSTAGQHLLYSLPLTQGIRLLKLALVEGRPILAAVNLGMLSGLVVNSLCYLLIGSAFFLLCEKKAKIDGRLGQY